MVILALMASNEEYSSMRSRKSSWLALCISMSMKRPSAVRAWMSNRTIFFPFFSVRRCIVGLRFVIDLISRLPLSRRMAFRKCMSVLFFEKIFLKTASSVGSKKVCFRNCASFSWIACSRFMFILSQRGLVGCVGGPARRTGDNPLSII